MNGVVHVDQVEILSRGVADRPRAMVDRLESGVGILLQRPIRIFVEPPKLAADTRCTVCVHSNVVSAIGQPFGEISQKEFGSSVCNGGNWNEWRGDKSNAHVCRIRSKDE